MALIKSSMEFIRNLLDPVSGLGSLPGNKKLHGIYQKTCLTRFPDWVVCRAIKSSMEFIRKPA
jgi:hypothetical protein